MKTHFLTIFFHCLRYFSRISSSRLVKTHFSVQEKRYYFLLSTFFRASGNHYSNYTEACLKLLSLLLPTIFFDFSDIPTIAVFSSSRNVFLNKFSIPVSGNRFSVFLKQYFFIWRFFSAIGNHRGNPVFEK